MSHRTMLSRLALTSAAAALAMAPAASAMPIDGPATGPVDLRGEAAISGGTGAAAPAPDRAAPLPPRAVPVLDGGSGGGVELPVVLVLAAGTLALGGGMAVAASRADARLRAA